MTVSTRMKWLMEDMAVAAVIARQERRMGAVAPMVNLIVWALGFVGLIAFILAVT